VLHHHHKKAGEERLRK